jgi:hypothetical protein
LSPIRHLFISATLIMALGACATNQAAPAATPTPANTPPPAATATTRPQPTPDRNTLPTMGPTTAPATQTAEVVDFPFEETDVQYVMVKQDLEIHAGPGETYPTIGPVFAGNFAQVTGVNAEGTWWRVFCPNDRPGNCWISADPALTEPATVP